MKNMPNLAERAAAIGRLSAKVREIEQRVAQRRADRDDTAYDDQPTPERRKP